MLTPNRATRAVKRALTASGVNATEVNSYDRTHYIATAVRPNWHRTRQEIIDALRALADRHEGVVLDEEHHAFIVVRWPLTATV